VSTDLGGVSFHREVLILGVQLTSNDWRRAMSSGSLLIWLVPKLSSTMVDQVPISGREKKISKSCSVSLQSRRGHSAGRTFNLFLRPLDPFLQVKQFTFFIIKNPKRQNFAVENICFADMVTLSNNELFFSARDGKFSNLAYNKKFGLPQGSLYFKELKGTMLCSLVVSSSNLRCSTIM
jgi:hypothetical protein